MNNGINLKLSLLDEYIAQLQTAISNKDNEDCKRLQKQIVAVYGKEIEGLTDRLDNYSTGAYYGSRAVDYIGDASLLHAILINYKTNLASGLYRVIQSKDGAVNVTQTVHQEVETEITISLEQTISAINDIPEETLSADDKEVLCGKLSSLSVMKNRDKTARWEKAKDIIKWVLDKGIDVAIAALPYILQALTGIAF